jgi:signal transduction histidine kinase
MFRSLYSKLAAVLLGLFCLVGVSFVLITMFSTEMYQQEVNQKLNRDLAEHIVAEKLLLQNNRINKEALEEIFHMLMVINPTIELYLLDTEGNILAFSAPPGKVKRKQVDLGAVKKWLSGDATLPVLGDDPRDPEGRKVFTIARIPEQGKLEGYLYIILGSQVYDSVVQKLQGSYILRVSVWVISACLLFALIAGLLLFALLTVRLRKLTTAMDTFKKSGTLDQKNLPPTEPSYLVDEIDRLCSTFKQMAERIGEQIEELREADTLRRELVANVSHDLRTPLATLQGYIETLLLKDSSLTVEDRLSYLKIAISHCKRLSKLVSELFELAKLDSNQTNVQRERFNMGELIQDVVQKFQLNAKEKQVNIITNIGQEFTFVNADIGLVERTLENLIENALRHTPQGGSISIGLKPDQENLMVQVSDTGCGIPQKELPRIFDRFYQLDKSRNAKHGYSGLGLAIAKRIIDLHESQIKVVSELNKGTTFSFLLPVAR